MLVNVSNVRLIMIVPVVFRGLCQIHHVRPVIMVQPPSPVPRVQTVRHTVRIPAAPQPIHVHECAMTDMGQVVIPVLHVARINFQQMVYAKRKSLVLQQYLARQHYDGQ